MALANTVLKRDKQSHVGTHILTQFKVLLINCNSIYHSETDHDK